MSFFSQEVYAIDIGENSLLYGPLGGIIAHVNRAGVNLIRSLDKSPERSLAPAEAEFIKQLGESGLHRSATGIQFSPCDERPFQPLCVSLYLTDACNLRCHYCYARGGDAPSPTTLSFAAATAGVDYVAECAKRQQADGFAVSFHGAGEPTLAWGLLTRIAGYARRLGEKTQMRVSLSTCTNGVMPEKHAYWLARHTDAANVSLDGAPAVQDAQRPLRAGGGSFSQVARTLKIFRDECLYHSIRSTITAANVREMASMVEMMAEEFGAAQLQFDPVLVAGRCSDTGCQAVDPDTFSIEFMRAVDRAQKLNVQLGFSVVSPDALRSYYCCAVSDGFTITHDGLVTSCFDVYQKQHPFADLFLYGRYDAGSSKFALDMNKMATLRQRHANNLTSCRRCFCKYMCCGDCPVNSLRAGHGLLDGGGRCRTTQSVAAHVLLARVLSTNRDSTQRIVTAEGNDYSLEAAKWAEGASGEPQVFSVARFPVRESSYMRPPPKEECRNILVAAGNAAYRKRDYLGALNRYHRALRLDSESPPVRNNIALTLHKLGHNRQAMKHAERGLAAEPENADLNMTYGKLLVTAKRLSDALRYFDKALMLEPARRSIRYNRGWVLAEMGRTKEAIEELRSLSSTPDRYRNDAAVVLHAIALYLDVPGDAPSEGGGQNGWMMVLNDCLAAVKTDGLTETDRDLVTSAVAFFAQEQYAMARSVVEKLLAKQPAVAALHALSGMLWHAQGDERRARKQLALSRDMLGSLRA